MERRIYLQPQSEVVRVVSQEEMMQQIINASNPKADGDMGYGGEGEEIDPETGLPIQ